MHLNSSLNCINSRNWKWFILYVRIQKWVFCLRKKDFVIKHVSLKNVKFFFHNLCVHCHSKFIPMINQNLSETSSYEQDTDYTILHHVNKACVMVLFTTECWIKKKLDFKQTKFSKSNHDHVILSFHDYIWKHALHSLKFLLKSRFFLFSSTLNSAWKSQAVAIAYNFFANIIGLDIVIFHR